MNIERRSLSDWTSNFDPRQLRIIDNCRTYAASDPAGLPGHQLMLLVAGMATLLDHNKPAPVRSVFFSVPFLSQWGEDADLSASDCGPACAAMAFNYFAEDVIVTVNDVTKMMAARSRYTNAADLFKFFRRYGFMIENYGSYDRRNGSLTLDVLRDVVVSRRIAIVLVHYATLNPGASFDGGHWICVVGCGDGHFVINDPYRRGDAGDHVKVSADVLAQAMADTVKDKNQANHGVVVWKGES